MSLIPQPGDLIFKGDDGKRTMRVGGNGSIIQGLVFDALTGEETSATVETYKYFTGGTGGMLVATVTITYSDSTKCFVLSAVKS